MKKILLLIAAASFGIVSCQKDEPIIDVSKKKYLMDGYWVFRGNWYVADISDPASPEVDNYASQQGCLKDNAYFFRDNGKFVMYEGDLKCNVTMPDSSELFWKFASDQEDYLLVYEDQGDVDNTLLWSGNMDYKTVDTFYLSYTRTDESSGVTSRTKEMYVKVK